jgi:hypothetical protein
VSASILASSHGGLELKAASASWRASASGSSGPVADPRRRPAPSAQVESTRNSPVRASASASVLASASTSALAQAPGLAPVFSFLSPLRP